MKAIHMADKANIIRILAAVFLICIFFSCNEDSQKKTAKKAPDIVSMKISKPNVPQKTKKVPVSVPVVKPDPKKTKMEPVGGAQEKKNQLPVEQKMAAHYSSAGKIDPFRALVQEKPPEPEPGPGPEPGPPRRLTPLEKVALSQIRLVAVIEMKNQRIAMVQEANGKGYEVSIGTYIGKQRGRITQIKPSSIVVTEPVRDYKGKLSERVRELKLHKNDIGE